MYYLKSRAYLPTRACTGTRVFSNFLPKIVAFMLCVCFCFAKGCVGNLKSNFVTQMLLVFRLIHGYNY